jgi:hypothetical protein
MKSIVHTIETVEMEEKLSTAKALSAVRFLVLSVFQKLDKRLNIPAAKKGGSLRLVGTAMAHAYKLGQRAGSKKCWRVEMEIPSAGRGTRAEIHICAVDVVKIGYDTVEADGMSIGMRGKVLSVREFDPVKESVKALLSKK